MSKETKKSDAPKKVTKEIEVEADKVMTADRATIKLIVPHGKRLPRITVSTSSPTPSVSKSVGGFVDFLREHAVVGLAVGFVLATQVQAVVKQLITSFIDPLFQLIFPGNKALSDRTFTLHFDGRHANFGWGAVAYAVIDFLFIAVAVYIIIKFFKLDKLDKKK